MTEEAAVFGVDVSRMDADRLANRFIRQDWLDIELALSHGKWFDYRFMSPVAATYLFAHEFKIAYKRAYSRKVDSVKAEFVKPLPDDLFDPPNVEKLSEKKGKKALAAHKTMVSGVWRARQVADAMGIPYDIYLSRAYYWVTRYWQQKHLPRPRQIYSDLATDRVAIDWDEFQRARLYYSKRPQYKAIRYDDRIKAQNDHHEWLFGQAATRHNAPSILAHMIDEDLLPMAKIESRLGKEISLAALELTAQYPQQHQL